MKNALRLKSAMNFFKKGITLSLLILLNTMASAHTGAPYPKGKNYSADDCTYTLSETFKRIGPEAAPDQLFKVTLTGSCSSWTAVSNASWITIELGTGTTGYYVYYSCTANTTTAERTGTITVGDKTCTVIQAGLFSPDKYEGTNSNDTAGKAYSLTPEFTQNASTIFILPANCHTINDIDYYKIDLGTDTYAVSVEVYDKDAYSNANYTLDSKISYSTNDGRESGSSRRFSVAVSGIFYLKIEPKPDQKNNNNKKSGSYAAKININKVSTAGCSYELSPGSSSQVTSDAGTGQITVTTTESCFWAATSNVGWITLTSSQGTGRGSVDYYYEEYTSTSPRTRTGTITVAGQTYSVTQQAASLPSPDGYEPNNTVADAESHSSFTPKFTQNASTLNISANVHIPNTSNTDVNNGDVDIYKINLGAAYTAYTVSGVLYDRNNDRENHTLNAKISYSTDGGGDSSWTPWVAQGDSPLPNLAVQSRVLYLKVEGANKYWYPTGSYAVKIDIIGGSCTYTLSDPGKEVTSEAGTGEVTVRTTGNSCPWTADEDESWIVLTSDQRTTGTGKVSYFYTKNTGTTSRTGTITIAGQTYTVTQAAAVPPALQADSYEPNNTPEAASILTTPAFTQNNVRSFSISQANCHKEDDVDIYKINLGTTYDSYTVSGALYDRDNQNNNSDYTLAAKIYYSTDGSKQSWRLWSWGGRQLSSLIVPGGILYLKIEPKNSGETGSYAVQIDLTGGCTYSLVDKDKWAASEAGSGQVTVIAGASGNSSCPWTAVSNASWITISSGQTTTGSGSVTYSYTENTETSLRSGTITIAGYTYTLTQEARPLSKDEYEDNNTVGTAKLLPATFTQNAATVSISDANCHKRGDVDFYKINLGTDSDSHIVSVILYDLYNQNNTGDLTLDVKVSYSTDGTTWSDWKDTYLSGIPARGTLYLKIAPYYWRTGTYAAKINILKVTAGCTYDLSTSEKLVTADAGSSGTVGVTTTSSCVWTAVSNASWITLTSGTSGTGSGNVGYSYTANTGLSSRTGTITIAGQTYAVVQSPASCSFTLTSSPANVTSTLGTGSAAVTANRGNCPWMATSNVAWLTLTSGPSGTGSGSVRYSYTANTGSSSRTGIITVADQTYTVIQSAADGCSYILSSNPGNFLAASGTGSVSVTADRTDCRWMASSNADWITIPSGQTLVGSVSVNYSYTANTSSISRTGTMTIAGQTYTVTQEPVPCSFTLTSSSANPTSALGTGSVAVTASRSNCSWTATSNVAWITLTSGQSGTGSGSVRYSYTANTESSSRMGTITIAGQTYTVTQEPVPCSFTLTSSSANPTSALGTGSVAVTASRSNCSWTATSNVAWITLTSGQSGTGSGSVGYSYTANTELSSRMGTITIAGQTYTVTQEPVPCSFTLTSSPANVTSALGTGNVAFTASRSNCPWTATSNVAWITLTSGQSGSGSGSVGYSYTENTSRDLRTGTITIAGQTFTVSQSAAAAAVLAGFETISHVHIFPNPARDYVTLDLSSTDKNYASIKIANQVGQVLYERENPQHKMQIPLKGLSSGLYFIILQGGEKAVVQKLMVE